MEYILISGTSFSLCNGYEHKICVIYFDVFEVEFVSLIELNVTIDRTFRPSALWLSSGMHYK